MQIEAGTINVTEQEEEGVVMKNGNGKELPGLVLQAAPPVGEEGEKVGERKKILLSGDCDGARATTGDHKEEGEKEEDHPARQPQPPTQETSQKTEPPMTSTMDEQQQQQQHQQEEQPGAIVSSSLAASSSSSSVSSDDEEEGKPNSSNDGGGGGIDPFLLQALANERDRITLLKLDKELERFIKDPSRQRLEFPHMTSFHRRMVHRVADYFKLAHIPETNGEGKRVVVLYKNTESKIPVLRFPDLCEKSSDSQPTLKIMRREQPQPKPKPHRILQRPSSSSSIINRNVAVSNGQKIETSPMNETKKTVATREEEYAKARALIFNGDDGSGSGGDGSDGSDGGDENSSSSSSSLNGDSQDDGNDEPDALTSKASAAAVCSAPGDQSAEKNKSKSKTRRKKRSKNAKTTNKRINRNDDESQWPPAVVVHEPDLYDRNLNQRVNQRDRYAYVMPPGGVQQHFQPSMGYPVGVMQRVAPGPQSHNAAPMQPPIQMTGEYPPHVMQPSLHHPPPQLPLKFYHPHPHQHQHPHGLPPNILVPINGPVPGVGLGSNNMATEPNHSPVGGAYDAGPPNSSSWREGRDQHHQHVFHPPHPIHQHPSSYQHPPLPPTQPIQLSQLPMSPQPLQTGPPFAHPSLPPSGSGERPHFHPQLQPQIRGYRGAPLGGPPNGHFPNNQNTIPQQHRPHIPVASMQHRLPPQRLQSVPLHFEPQHPQGGMPHPSNGVHKPNPQVIPRPTTGGSPPMMRCAPNIVPHHPHQQQPPSMPPTFHRSNFPPPPRAYTPNQISRVPCLRSNQTGPSKTGYITTEVAAYERLPPKSTELFNPNQPATKFRPPKSTHQTHHNHLIHSSSSPSPSSSSSSQSPPSSIKSSPPRNVKKNSSNKYFHFVPPRLKNKVHSMNKQAKQYPSMNTSQKAVSQHRHRVAPPPIVLQRPQRPKQPSGGGGGGSSAASQQSRSFSPNGTQLEGSRQANPTLMFDYSSTLPNSRVQYMKTEPSSTAPHHILEVYDLPDDIKNWQADILLDDVKKAGGSIKWLTPTIIVVVFPNASTAEKALQTVQNDKYKLRHWSGRLK